LVTFSFLIGKKRIAGRGLKGGLAGLCPFNAGNQAEKSNSRPDRAKQLKKKPYSNNINYVKKLA